MKIQFCGAASGVTGSCHLITTDRYKILLDCGQFQGGKAIEAMNYEPFPFNPEEIDFLILSHAHIDHCGRIPLLVKQGFRGKIYCTDATADLLDVMLKDSGYIHEKEAEWQNRKNERAGRPLIEPLYTYNDSLNALKYVNPVLYDQLIEPNDQIKIVFNEAGHILGSAIIEIWVEENGEAIKLVFSGDIGVKGRPILRDPKIIKKADYVIMETTYGNRLHEENSDSIEKLIDIVLKTIRRGGNVVIPSFAVGRTQELIYQFNRFYEENSQYKEELDNITVYIDSPMATTATEVFKKNAQVFDEETKEYILKGDNPLDFPNLKFTRTSDDSRAINFNNEPKVIISASGMCEAGRIRHHLKHNLWDARNSIVFVGYQAEGTLGRLLVTGTDRINLFGEEVKVNAEIHNLEGFSGHADRDGLYEWLSGFQKKPKHTFLVHGEQDSKDDFASYVKENMGYECTVITGVSEFELTNVEVKTIREEMRREFNEEAVLNIKSRIAGINEDLQKILYNTHLAVSAELSPERIAEINNIVLELEKQSINLGSAVTKEDRIDESAEA